MQRNIEVHNENRALEEQLGEMEKVLVETKMGYAQVSDHVDEGGCCGRWSMANNCAATLGVRNAQAEMERCEHNVQ